MRRQIPDYSDYRSRLRCAYCGGATGTRDHVPSRVLLNEPFPDNLPVVPACRTCNQSFSWHEEYLACLIAVVLAGDIDAVAGVSAKAARILDSKPALRAKIVSARSGEPYCPTWAAELERVGIVLRKLAQGHVYHEIAEPRAFDPACSGLPLCLRWAQPAGSSSNESTARTCGQKLEATRCNGCSPARTCRAMGGLSYKTAGIVSMSLGAETSRFAWFLVSTLVASFDGTPKPAAHMRAVCRRCRLRGGAVAGAQLVRCTGSDILLNLLIDPGPSTIKNERLFDVGACRYTVTSK